MAEPRPKGRTGAIPVGEVRLGDLAGRTEPVSAVYGCDRGRAIDRYYIEAFLDRHRADVRGRVLEVGERTYTQRYGGDRVTKSDIVHVHDVPEATIVADLARADGIADASFDCLLLTQTLHLIYDMPAAMRELHRILSPGGTVLATVPGISQIDRLTWGEAWCWTLSRTSATRLFTDAFGPGNVGVEVHGNVLAATSFLYGLSVEEVDTADLDVSDPCYPVTIAVRAVKGAR